VAGTFGTIYGERRVAPSAEATNDRREPARPAAGARTTLDFEPLTRERSRLHLPVTRETDECHGDAPPLPREERQLVAVPEAQHPRSWVARIEPRIDLHASAQGREVGSDEDAEK
jgi:hypothetical protein